MIILFFLLSFNLLPKKWLEPGCKILVSYMPLLFVPVSVGIMQYFLILKEQFLLIIVSCTLSTLIVLLTIVCAAYLINKR